MVVRISKLWKLMPWMPYFAQVKDSIIKRSHNKATATFITNVFSFAVCNMIQTLELLKFVSFVKNNRGESAMRRKSRSTSKSFWRSMDGLEPLRYSSYHGKRHNLQHLQRLLGQKFWCNTFVTHGNIFYRLRISHDNGTVDTKLKQFIWKHQQI